LLATERSQKNRIESENNRKTKYEKRKNTTVQNVQKHRKTRKPHVEHLIEFLLFTTLSYLSNQWFTNPLGGQEQTKVRFEGRILP